MAQLLFFVLLLLMIPPALLAVVFASRHWMAIIWNGFWFMVIGEVAVRAFASPDAKYLGLVFFGLYIYRVLFRPVPKVKFQFYGTQTASWANPSPNRTKQADTTERSVDPIESDAQVIEAEFKKLSSNEIDQPRL